MKSIEFTYKHITPFIQEHELEQMQGQISQAHEALHQRNGAGSDFLGWLDWPETYDQAEYQAVKSAARRIRQDSELLVVIGIGGSYLGARAAIEFLSDTFYEAKAGQKGNPHVVFAGNNISGTYMEDLLDLIGDRDFSINVISKSGTTTEPSLTFRILKEKLIDKYGQEEAGQRIYATTDQVRGALHEEAEAQGYETFVIPDAIGGRFTVLTPVGLLPIAVAGFDIDELMAGAQHAMHKYQTETLADNQAYQYAALRNIFYRKGKIIEILVNYEPSLAMFGEWWKQLFGESEGKDQRGIYPSSANFSTDLHSLGQYIQDGSRIMYETVLHVQEPRADIQVPSSESNLDGLAYLEGMTMNEVNDKAYQGTILAHTDGQVPNLVLDLPDMTEATLGQMIYFFEIAVAISGYLNAINPFDQPGVEEYKRNMFALLGKPGFESLAQELNERL